MAKRILVDAVHPEEVRVAVADESKLIEFEFESEQKKQIKSNIYLGKITRVEPSLQAAFVEYGGNRQGFLPFSEIHYDYYQIPTEDREKLNKAIQEEREKNRRFLEQEDEEDENPSDDKSKKPVARSKSKNYRNKKSTIDIEIPSPFSEKDAQDLKRAEELAREFALEIMGEDYVIEHFSNKEAQKDDDEDVNSEEPEEQEVEEEVTELNSLELYKQYKIQEVIKRNQVVLIQVVKEERGNKGASLTTYLALAGRYCVFMPNTEKGGGVSRRITSFSERKRIRNVLKTMDIPDGTSLIIRTAGMEKEDQEIKDDFDYMVSLWNDIRQQTLESTAPALIYEESDLVKRSLRDLLKGDISEVIIEGDESYKNAKKFFDAVSSEQSKLIKQHKSKIPVFQKFKIEEKLDELYEPEAKLESGGSIVITPTEALVSIDVNSGKATKERSVEDTALKTNLEAAREIARQLRLRDLAGLIVIDFIDMRDVRNRKAIERELKDALRNDRAKIQVGRISTFGLLEMSRQRMHSSILESSSACCPMCKGMGIVRTLESSVIRVIRSIEAESGKKTVKEIHIYCSYDISKFLLDNKLEELQRIEEDDEVTILIKEDYSLLPNQYEITTNKNTNRSLGNMSSAPKRVSKKGGGKTSDSKDDDNNNDKSSNRKKKGGPKNKPYNKNNPSNKNKNNQKNDDGNYDNSENDQESQDQANVKPLKTINDSDSSEGDEDNSEKASRLKGLWKKITS
jgi:ribonuclease E